MEESQSFGHQHPLLLLLNDEQINNGFREAECWRCTEKVSAPCFSCAECRGFYLHKVCADPPSEINHPLHRDHPLVLVEKSPDYYHITQRRLRFLFPGCDFCDEPCQKFIYQCSCGLHFHIKCALFTYNIAQENLKELEHVSLEDPLISSENDTEKNDGEEPEDPRMCFGCWEPLANYTYFSLDCGFNLHKKCAELPLNLNSVCHRKHLLVLQFNSERRPCQICDATQSSGFVYGCSACEFVFHVECVPPPFIEAKGHQHPFTPLRRLVPFICDACGTEGHYFAYICCTCNIIVHKNCTSLPRIIKSNWHDHRIFHTYFLQKDFRSLDCIICHDEVKWEHGSYSCSYCEYIFHVNCVTEDKSSYFIISLGNEEKSRESLELLADISIESITYVFQRNNAGEATEIKHFKHIHKLMLSDKIREYDKSCDGCMLPILDSFYYCSQCDFFLHKTCAELPRKKQVWHHGCPLSLTSNKTFKCGKCRQLSNAFAYTCDTCLTDICLRCIIALTPGALTCSKHEHPLFYYKDRKGECNACGRYMDGVFCCKVCYFTLHRCCFSLPLTARHKCDEHLLALTYHDDNSYLESHYCDICEERRDPNHWFYRCATCDTSAHIDCVLGRYPFIKPGGIYEDKEKHPHPLTFVKKIYYYPDCVKCDKPCTDLALECKMPGCNYIAHCACMWSFNEFTTWDTWM